MVVTAMVNGELQTQSRRVQVNPCPPTGDPLLDSPDFRRRLEHDLQASGIGNPNDQQRTEIGGLWWLNANDSSVRYLPITPDSANNCGLWWRGENHPGMPGEILIGGHHTHPYWPNDIISGCGGDNVPGRYDPSRTGGGSLDDWLSTDGLGVPEYTTDPTHFYRLDPGTPPSDRPLNPHRWTRGPDGCPTGQP